MCVVGLRHLTPVMESPRGVGSAIFSYVVEREDFQEGQMDCPCSNGQRQKVVQDKNQFVPTCI